MPGRRRSRGRPASRYATTRMTGDARGKKRNSPLRSGGPVPDGTAEGRPHGRRERQRPDDRAGDWDDAKEPLRPPEAAAVRDQNRHGGGHAAPDAATAAPP